MLAAGVSDSDSKVLARHATGSLVGLAWVYVCLAGGVRTPPIDYLLAPLSTHEVAFYAVAAVLIGAWAGLGLKAASWGTSVVSFLLASAWGLWAVVNLWSAAD
ncbi:MAG: hypothetical protein KDB73_18595 [Planctomycetes bacterium]|nr:hypothetical protein [Planctomycetota bacterium]